MTRFGVAPVNGRSLDLELLDPGVARLVRLFRHPGGEWAAPPQRFRNLRVDPPPGHKSAFAVLYIADTLPTVAMECRVLAADDRDRYTWSEELARQYKVVRYEHDRPMIMLPIDGPNRVTLGLDGATRQFSGYEPYQRVAHQMHRQYGKVVHGLSWESFHRNQPGRIYALWHGHKRTVGLRIASAAPYGTLIDDAEWQDFLARHPAVDRMRTP
jgi:hypothetical protein